jgi:hypothetical protein
MTPQTVAIREADKPYQTPFIVRTSRLKREPAIRGDELDRALPKFSPASSQTHNDHKLLEPTFMHSQQQTDKVEETPKEEKKRVPKKQRQTPEPAVVRHKYCLRSGSGK